MGGWHLIAFSQPSEWLMRSSRLTDKSTQLQPGTRPLQSNRYGILSTWSKSIQWKMIDLLCCLICYSCSHATYSNDRFSDVVLFWVNLVTEMWKQLEDEIALSRLELYLNQQGLAAVGKGTHTNSWKLSGNKIISFFRWLK